MKEVYYGLKNGKVIPLPPKNGEAPPVVVCILDGKRGVAVKSNEDKPAIYRAMQIARTRAEKSKKGRKYFFHPHAHKMLLKHRPRSGWYDDPYELHVKRNAHPMLYGFERDMVAAAEDPEMPPEAVRQAG